VAATAVEPGGDALRKHEILPLGVVIEWRRVSNPWIDHVWKPVDVFPGAPAADPKGAWTLLDSGEGWARYHAGTLPLELFRGETAGYLLNLSQSPPRVFVMLRQAEAAAERGDLVPFHVTACPQESQDYLDADEIVEPVPMPPAVVALVREFVQLHHVDVPFEKRKRKRWRSTPPEPGSDAANRDG